MGLSLASPMIRGAVRLVGEADVASLHDSTRANAFFTAGGESGLRGYGLNEFRGQARFVGHLEARSRPLPLGALRFGGLAFYDAGHAAASLSALRPRQDVGLGLRLLIPQLNFYVLRVDWAFPLQAGDTTRPGWPGRVSAGFARSFESHATSWVTPGGRRPGSGTGISVPQTAENVFRPILTRSDHHSIASSDQQQEVRRQQMGTRLFVGNLRTGSPNPS